MCQIQQASLEGKWNKVNIILMGHLEYLTEKYEQIVYLPSPQNIVQVIQNQMLSWTLP